MLILFDAPITSVSGYGAHARDILRAMMKQYPEWNFKILDKRWGDCPRNALVKGRDDDLMDCFLTDHLYRQPDIHIQVTVPTEFNPMGRFNIGITAGIETTAADPRWVEGCNKMSLLIVTSQHSKKVFETSDYQVTDSRTGQPAGQLKLTAPVEVLFEGSDLSVYHKTDNIHKTIVDELNKVAEDFCFLTVGHWLPGNIGHDRKDIGMTIKTFCDTFGRKTNPPALIIKTSGATFSAMDREEIVKRIHYITKGSSKPSIYLVHGDLSDEEMNSLYNHPKVKAIVSFTHGECYGRPLQEFALTGKPVIAPNWSGQCDFLNPKYSVLLPGALKKIHPSAVWQGVLNDGTSWFYVDYFYAQRILGDIWKDYGKYLKMGNTQREIIEKHFSLDRMSDKIKEILDKYSSQMSQEKTLKIPLSLTKKVGDGNEPLKSMPKLKKL